MGNILDEFKTQELCDRAIEKDVYLYFYIPHSYRTGEMNIKCALYRMAHNHWLSLIS